MHIVCVNVDIICIHILYVYITPVKTDVLPNCLLGVTAIDWLVDYLV